MPFRVDAGEPNEKHGDSANITYDDLERAAAAGKVSPEEAANNIRDGLKNS